MTTASITQTNPLLGNLQNRLLTQSLLAVLFIVVVSFVRILSTGWLLVDAVHLLIGLLAAAAWAYRNHLTNTHLTLVLTGLVMAYCVSTILQLGFASVALPLFLATAVVMSFVLGYTTTLTISIAALVVFALSGFIFYQFVHWPASSSGITSLLSWIALAIASFAFIPVISGYLKNQEQLHSDQLDKAQKEGQSSHQGQYDPLTSLPVLQVTLDRLRHELDRIKRSDCMGAVMFLDVDNFRDINERHGNQAGDLVLRTLASRIASIVRAADTLSRIGGDEFVAIFADQKDENQVRLIARKLLATVNNPITFNNTSIDLHVSIGVALFPDHSVNPQELIALADKSSELVKASGGNNYRISSTEL
jgi:diguanylate cyclase (GGDEF) domain